MNSMQAKMGRRRRVRAKIRGRAARPRLVVEISLKRTGAQILDDDSGRSLLIVREKAETGTRVERAAALGKRLAAEAKVRGIETVVFDRAGHLYHGRVRALAEAAREGGLKF